MYSSSFEYFRPKTLAEAAQLLKKHKGARLLAGGHSLLPAMKFRLATPKALVDLGGIKGLSGIKAKGKALEIGATTTHAEIAASTLVKKSCPILAEAASQIGDIQVRNRGTIGGSVAHADPAADFPTVLVALGATVLVERPEGCSQDSRGQVLRRPLHDGAETRRARDGHRRSDVRQGHRRRLPQAPPSRLPLRRRGRRGDRRGEERQGRPIEPRRRRSNAEPGPRRSPPREWPPRSPTP